MLFRRIRTLFLVVVVLAAGCGMKEDWSNPKYVERQMSRGDERAFHAFQEGDEAFQRQLIPALIEVYNSNVSQREALRALLSRPDERAIPVFRNALARNDDALAVLGARGLAGIGDVGSAGEIAQRMGSLTEGNAYMPFIDALTTLGSDDVVDNVASVVLRPADRIGGAETVRKACELFAQARTVSDRAIEAMVFGLVNIRPQPLDDTFRNCEMAILQHRDAALPKVIELYTGEFTRATEHMESLGFSSAAARLRGAMVLSHLRNHEANNAIRAWVNTRQVVPRAELSTQPIERQMAWYDNHGQLFDVSMRALAHERNPADLPLLRSLEQPGSGNALDNFSPWFSLSEGAELGLRQSAQIAIAAFNQDQDRTMLWDRVANGTIGRGGEQTRTLFHLNTMHIVGRLARQGDLARYERAVNAQPERWRHEFRALIGYFLTGEHCHLDMDCRAGLLQDPAPALEHPSVARLLDAEEDEAARTVLRNGIRWAAQSGAVWQLAIMGGDAAACGVLLDQLNHSEQTIRNLIPEALYFCRELPADAGARLDAWLESTASLRGVPGLPELRHTVRTLRVQL